jgi:AcrR family transcriptional regulator
MPSPLREPRPSTRAKRARTLAAAQCLFLERGYSGTSMDAIALGAGITKQTLYAYFGTKADLFSAVLRELTLEGPARSLRVAADDPPPGDLDGLRRVLRGLVGGIAAAMFQPDYVALVRVIVAEVPRTPDLGPLFRAAVADQALGTIADLLRSAIAAGAARTEEPEAAASLLLGALVLCLFRDGLLAAPGTETPPRPGELDALVNQLLLGISPPSEAGGTVG